MTQQLPKWLQDFNQFLMNLQLNYDTRQKIIKVVINILNTKKKEWEKRHLKNQNPEKLL